MEKKMKEKADNIKKQLTDLRMDYDELTDWVSQLHHKLDNHIKEYNKYVKEKKKEKHRDAISILIGVAILFAILALSGLKICGII